MPIPGLDPDKCKQRNRIAARRDSVEAASIRLYTEYPAEPREALAVTGKLPRNTAEAMSLINALRTGGEPLTEDDVWIHYLEAANGNFVQDRYLFLGTSTLKNIARQAPQGVAFMNSHRTGGMSHPSELPFGRTFCGRYEEHAGGKRAICGVYMLRGQHPNGQNGPSTDDLHAGIEAGTIFDVSVRLYGGRQICDVCGEDVNAWDPQTYEYLCPHVPGTHHAMSNAEQKAQKDRGAKDGCASYTYEDAVFSEVSAVYDGAVPGAGFLKALSLAASGALPHETLSACRTAYAPLCGKRDFSAQPPDRATVEEYARGLQAFWGGEFSETPPGGVRFEEQVDAALADVRACLERGRDIADLRGQLGVARLAQLADLETELRSLRELSRPKADPVKLQALRLHALRLRADAISLGVKE